MKIKSIITLLLLLFIATSVGYLIIQEVNNNSGIQAENSITGTKYIVYYFHRTMRCPTCIDIENFTDEAIKTGFTDDLKSKQLEWRVVNIEDKGNEHFENDYQLYAQSVILVEIKDGKQVRWKNLKQIWDIVGNKEGFINYIQKEIRSFMGGES